MHSCGICVETVESPVALPCGHIFCNKCVLRAVNAITQYSTLHCCPSCRAQYSVGVIDPASAPLHLRHHLTPSVRRLYLDAPQLPRKITPEAEIAVENRRLLAENSALQTNCKMWRRRAELQGLAILDLLDVVRSTKDQASKMQSEKDELRQQANAPKKGSDHDDSLSYQSFAEPLLSTQNDAIPMLQMHKRLLLSTQSSHGGPSLTPGVSLMETPGLDETAESDSIMMSTRPRKRMRPQGVSTMVPMT